VAGRSIAAEWRSVGFIHWAYEPEALAGLLPDLISPDLYGGRAWAGYQFTTVSFGRGRIGRWPPLDRLPWRVQLRPEHHEVRAVIAVVDRLGRPGVWYPSVDTNRKTVAAGFRRWLNLSAYESESRFSTADDRVDYWTKRPDGTSARLNLTIGPKIDPTDVDHFLTARWRIVLPPRHWESPNDARTITTVHEPWILHRASVELFDDDVLVAAGLPPAIGPGQALWSPGTSVTLGWSDPSD